MTCLPKDNPRACDDRERTARTGFPRAHPRCRVEQAGAIGRLSSSKRRFTLLRHAPASGTKSKGGGFIGFRTQMNHFLRAAGLIWCTISGCAAYGAELETTVPTCGGTRFTAITHSVHDCVTAQEMWARPSGAKQARPVDLRQSTIVLRRIVPGLVVVADEASLCGCAKTSKGDVLMLWYDCSQVLPGGVPAQFCSKSGEWYRHVATDGTLPDQGFGLGRGLGDTDPREQGLRARLGLAADHEDVKFRDVRW